MRLIVQEIHNVPTKEYYLSEFFDILCCGKEKTKDIKIGHKYPFVTAKACNNGVHCLTDNGKHLFKGNTIIFVKDGNGGGGTPYYQEYDFYANSHILILQPKIELNREIGLFLVSCLQNCKNQFHHTRSINKDTFQTIKIVLPCNSNNKVDWEYMTNYIKKVETELNLPKFYNKLKKFKEYFLLNKEEKVTFPNSYTFNLLEIFKNLGGGREIIKDTENGNIPLISSGRENNGIEKYIKQGKKLFKKNKLTLAKNGSVGQCFYQNKDFYATSDVLILENPNLNKFTGLFLIPIIEKSSKIYVWHNKIDEKNLMKIRINIPAIQNINGVYEPNWQYMEDFIKSLPYADLI